MLALLDFRKPQDGGDDGKRLVERVDRFVRNRPLDPTELVSNAVLVWGRPISWFSRLRTRRAPLAQRNVNTIDQRGTRKRLRQQADGTGLQCSGADTLAWEGRDKDKRRVVA